MKLLYPNFFISVRPVFVKAILFAFALIATLASSAQSLNFSTYQLINGGDGQKGAEYRFANVLSDANGNAVADCIVRIDEISAGVALKQIDNDKNESPAFQPVVEHMNTTGPSWIEFSFSFVPHTNKANSNSMFELPLLAASFYGLNGFDRAQEFAECDLGRNSQVVYETEINNLMVTRIGNSFRAENKWGVQTSKMPGGMFNEKFSLLNQQVTGLKVKFGVNRKAQTWAGTSTYNLALSKSAPELMAYQPKQQLNYDLKTEKYFASAGSAIINNNTVVNHQLNQVEMQLSTKIISEQLKLHLPLNWTNKEVTFELYLETGEILQKVIAHKAAAVEALDLKSLPEGSFVIRAKCGSEFAMQQVIHAEQL